MKEGALELYSEVIKELEKLKGKTFERHGRTITIDFEIKLTDGGVLICLDENIPDWWNVYWHLKYDGAIDHTTNIIKERNKVRYGKPVCFSTGVCTYTDLTFKKTNGGIIKLYI